jgi:hypothetical protein
MTTEVVAGPSDEVAAPAGDPVGTTGDCAVDNVGDVTGSPLHALTTSTMARAILEDRAQSIHSLHRVRQGQLPTLPRVIPGS